MEATTEFKMVPLKDIKPDPNQPRKYYDETAMQELTDSVREKGVLQPVLLRPKGKTYLLVCGERRYRASCAVNIAIKDRAFIPAVIKEMSDDEALELQIVENLQRKDVHPMEEAVAFKSLLDHGKEIKEIAARVGKSEFYARQRVKLCSMTEDWQKAFYAGRISITDALKVALFDENIQTSLYDENKHNREINIGNWDLRKYSGDLNDAPFDLNNAALDKKMGACVNCSFNTSTAMLFVDSQDKPRCTNITCYQKKCVVHFEVALAQASNEPDMIFVSDEYGSALSDKNTKALEQLGFKIYGRRDYETHSLPDKPDMKRFEEEWMDDNEGDPNGMEEAFQKEVDDFLKQSDEYQKEVAGGKYKKAFVLNGNSKGKFIYITLNKTSASSANSKKVKSKEETGELSVEDINEEIDRIKSKELRSKELDQQKIWETLHKQFNPGANASVLKGEFTQLEREAIATSLYNKLSYPERNHFEKMFNARKGFANVTEETLRQMTRFYMLATLPPSPSSLYSGYNDEAKICMRIAKDYFPGLLKEAEDAQGAISAKRIEKVNKRIADLKAKKK